MYPWLKKTWTKLLRVFSGEYPPRCILLHGADGLGKKEMAKEICHYFLCENQKPEGYCSNCHSCKLLDSNTHPDLIILNNEIAESNTIGIEYVREMIEQISQTSKIGCGVAVIIENAELLTEAAANSILKILEEPKGKVLFVLTSDNMMKLLPTILSRCIKFKIPTPTFSESCPWLKDNVENKNIDLRHFFILNNCSPLATKRFIDNGYLELLDSLITSLVSFVEDHRLIENFTDTVQAITNKIVGEQGKSKPKPSIKHVYNWLYYIVSDIFRYQVTHDGRNNIIILNNERLDRFNKISIYRLHEAIIDLQDMLSNENLIPSSYTIMHLKNWLNNLVVPTNYN